MTRISWLPLVLAAGVTLLAAAPDPETPATKKKPAPAASASGPKSSAPAKAASQPAKPGAATPKPAAKPDGKDAEPVETSAEPKEKPAEAKKDDPNLGMSILGNQEAPKALVIVPWKSSEIGLTSGLQMLLDDSRQPIDKDVFLRVLNYYELRTTTTPTTTRQNGAKGGKP
jgi:hypothetical protein